MPDEEEEEQQPIWRFSLWDVAGAIFYGVETTAEALKSECLAMANWQRNRFDSRERDNDLNTLYAKILTGEPLQ